MNRIVFLLFLLTLATMLCAQANSKTNTVIVFSDSLREGIFTEDDYGSVFDATTTYSYDNSLVVGDLYDEYEDMEYTESSLVTFSHKDLDSTRIPQKVLLYIYLSKQVGDDESDNWPDFYTGPDYVADDTCRVSHVDTGDSDIEYSRMSVLDENMAYISPFMPLGWLSIDVTPYFLKDRERHLEYSQFLFKFIVNSDFDYASDYLEFGNSRSKYRPYLLITYAK